MNNTQDTHKYDFRYLLNFRDIGGIGTSGNGRIRKGIIFRSANPDRLHPHDIKKLRSLNIRTVIDLRSPSEVSNKYVPVDHADLLSLPLDFQQTTRDRLKPVIRTRNAKEAIVEISNTLYLEILDAVLPVFSDIMEILASPDRTPVLIHCQAGKDRTGIVIALILLSLGADKESIIDDFMKSNDYLLPFFRRRLYLRKLLTLGFFPAGNVLFAVTVRQKNIESVLDRIRDHYGGIENYLKQGGFDLAKLPEIKKRCLEM